MATPIAVSMRDVDFGYQETLVLEDVTLSIAEGDFVGIVGPNAGGKTTLLKLMLGLLEPLRGQVRVFGEPPERVSGRIGYLPQDWACTPAFPVSTMDVVLMGRLGTGRSLGPYSREDREAARWALEQVGLDGTSRRNFCDLSGGQRQRALVARAIAARPDILMLDEPMSGVDAAAAHELQELLEELHQSMTVIMVSHDLGMVTRTVESVLCVNRQVVRHPTSDLTDVSGELLADLYGEGIRLVRHDLAQGDE